MTTTLSNNAGTIEVTIAGRFTTDEAAPFLKDIEPLMEERGKTVVIDLAGLEFISIAGIRCFVMLLKACTANSTALRLKNLTPQIKDIFTLTALIDKFEVE